MNPLPKLPFFFIVLSLLLLVVEGAAQDTRKVVQLSGVILAEDSLSGVEAAHIYVPRTGQGTISNPLGYFSLPVLESDSVVVSSIGYETVHYIVPRVTKKRFLTVIVQMKPSLTRLQGIDVMPFPTEEAFKGAILAMNIPANKGVILPYPGTARIVLMNAGTMESYANYRYYMGQYLQSVDDSFRGRTNPFLDPLSWYRFIRDLTRKRKTKK